MYITCLSYEDFPRELREDFIIFQSIDRLNNFTKELRFALSSTYLRQGDKKVLYVKKRPARRGIVPPLLIKYLIKVLQNYFS